MHTDDDGATRSDGVSGPPDAQVAGSANIPVDDDSSGGKHQGAAHGDSEVDGGAGAPKSDPRAGNRRRVVAKVLLGVGVVILACTGWVAWRSYQAYHHLLAAHDLVSEITAQMGDGAPDSARLVSLVDQVGAEAGAARSAVQDPLFRAGTILPYVGSNLQAVRQLTLSLDDVATSAGRTLPEILSIRHNGAGFTRDHVDVPTITAAATAVVDFDAAVQRADRTIESVATGHLVKPVLAAVQEYRGALGKVAPATTAGATAARILLPMLGGGGVRDYLIVFQNPAELRATGGIFGYYAVLHIDNGSLSLRAYGSSGRDIGVFDEPPSSLEPEVEALYSGRMTQYPQDVNFTPDFPTAASLFSQMYHARTGHTVDGVIALDPVVVSVLLDGAPTVPLGHGLELSSSTAVQVLLKDLYTVFPSGAQNAQRDALMQSSTAAAFTAVLDNIARSNPVELARALAPVVRERRVLVWSRSAPVESALLATPLGGRLMPDAPGRPTVGVFFNDGTGGKLDYYLAARARIDAADCRANGVAAATLTVTLSDTAPSTGLPDYVVGQDNIGKTYTLQTNVVLAAPSSGSIGEVRVDGATVPVLRGTDHGRSVAIVTVRLAPGENAAVTAQVLMEPAAQPAGGQPGTVAPSLVVTPMASSAETSVETFDRCNSQQDR